MLIARRPWRKCSTLGAGTVIFGVDPRVLLDEAEIVDVRMRGEADAAGHAHALGLGLDAVEDDAVADLIELDAVEPLEEIELPPRAAQLAVGGELEPDLLLLLIALSISRSSTARSAPAVISWRSCFARASLSAAGRSRLPTWSARNGGASRCIVPPICRASRHLFLLRLGRDLATADTACKSRCASANPCGQSAGAHGAKGKSSMPPVLRLCEDVLSDGAALSLPALPRLVFMVHGSIAAGDRVLRDGEAWSGEDAAAFKAGGEGATVWRWELGAAETGDVVAGPAPAPASPRAKSLQRASTPCRKGRCSCAATASPSRPAAAPICIGIRGRASAA